MGVNASMPEGWGSDYVKDKLGIVCRRLGYTLDNDSDVYARGAQGYVFIVNDDNNGNKLAVKILPRQSLYTGASQLHQRACSRASVSSAEPSPPGMTFTGYDTIPDSPDKYIENEMKAVKLLIDQPHPNIIRFDNIVDEFGLVMLFMEFAHGGDLRGLIEGDHHPLDVLHDSDLLLKIVLGILRGMNHIHRLGFLHRDIKPENIVLQLVPSGRLDSSVTPKLVDFGLISMKPDTLSSPGRPKTFAGTKGYMAPEFLKTMRFTDATDMFAVGVTLYELLQKKIPFDGEYLSVTDKYATQDFQRYNRSINALKNSSAPPLLKKLCHSMLQLNPRHRPTATQALSWMEQNRRPNIVPKPALAADPTEIVYEQVLVQEAPGRRGEYSNYDAPYAPGPDPRYEWIVPRGYSQQQLKEEEPKDPEAERAALGSAAMLGLAAGAVVAVPLLGPIAAYNQVQSMPTRVAEVAREQVEIVCVQEQLQAADVGGVSGAAYGSIGGLLTGGVLACVATTAAISAPVVLVGAAGGLATGLVGGGLSGRWCGWWVMRSKQTKALEEKTGNA